MTFTPGLPALRFSDLTPPALDGYKIFMRPLTVELQANAGLGLGYVSSKDRSEYQNDRNITAGKVDTGDNALQISTALDNDRDPACYLVIRDHFSRENTALQMATDVEVVGSGPSCRSLTLAAPKVASWAKLRFEDTHPQAAEGFLLSLPPDFQLAAGIDGAVAQTKETTPPPAVEAPVKTVVSGPSVTGIAGALLAAALGGAVAGFFTTRWRAKHHSEHDATPQAAANSAEGMWKRQQAMLKKWQGKPISEILELAFFKAPSSPKRLSPELAHQAENVAAYLDEESTLVLVGPPSSGKTALINNLASQQKTGERRLIRLDLDLLFAGFNEEQFEFVLAPVRRVLEDTGIRLVVEIPTIEGEEQKAHYQKIIRRLPGVILEMTPETYALLKMDAIKQSIRVDIAAASPPPKNPGPASLRAIP